MIMNKEAKPGIVQFVRYACVGVMNTLVTLCVIFLCKSLLGINPLVSNAIGYIAGVINSFLGFIVCYGIQFLVVWLLNYKTALRGYEIDIYSFTLSGYGLATLIGNVVYTGSNFMFNKLVTFKTHL